MPLVSSPLFVSFNYFFRGVVENERSPYRRSRFIKNVIEEEQPQDKEGPEVKISVSCVGIDVGSHLYYYEEKERKKKKKRDVRNNRNICEISLYKC